MSQFQQKSLQKFYNKNTNNSSCTQLDSQKSDLQSKPKQHSTFKSSCKIKRQNYRKQKRKQQINKIFASKRKQIVFKNTISSTFVPSSANIKKQIQKILLKFIPIPSKIISLWTFLQKDIALCSIISFDTIIQILKSSINISITEDQFQSKYALECALLIALNWKAINRQFKIRKINHFQIIIQICSYSLSLDFSSLNSYAFICLGNFVSDQNFKNYLSQNCQIEKFFDIKIQAHNIQDITFFTLNFLSCPSLIGNSLGQKIIQFLEFNYCFFFQSKYEQESDDFFFLKLDYLQIIHKLSNQNTLNQEIKKRAFEKMACMMRYYHYRKWKSQNYKINIFCKWRYQVKYFQTIIQLYSIPLSQESINDKNFMKQILKLCVNIIQEDTNQIQNKESLQNDKRIELIWKFLRVFCKNQKKQYNESVKEIYEYVIQKIKNEKYVKYHNEYKLFLCQVDEQQKNNNYQNKRILQYLSNELQYEEDQRLIKIIIKKVQRMIQILQIKRNNIDENMIYRIKVLSISDNQQIRQSVEKLNSWLGHNSNNNQDLYQCQYDKILIKQAKQVKKTQKSSVTSKFTFNQ